MSLATNGMCKSLCSVKLETYHGGPVMDRRILDCSRCMMCMGRLRTAPELNTIRPHRLEHAFVQEKLVVSISIVDIRR